jgi:hypothetical protein
MMLVAEGSWLHQHCQVFDGYLVKYGATAVALLAYAAPLYMRRETSTASQDDLTQDYIRSMRLLQNTAR